MSLTVDQQQKVIEAEKNLDVFLTGNPHMMGYQANLNEKFEAAKRPEQILKTVSSPVKKKPVKKTTKK